MKKLTPFDGVVELDESYFGPRRIRGKRGRGASGKTIVFGIFKRDDKVYTEIVPDASNASLVRVIRGHVSIDSVIHTDGWRGYNGLVDVGYSKHFRVHHGVNEFASTVFNRDVGISKLLHFQLIFKSQCGENFKNC